MARAPYPDSRTRADQLSPPAGLQPIALVGEALRRGWEVGLRQDVVWVGTQVRFFFANTRDRTPQEALAEAYQLALDWSDRNARPAN